MRWYLIAGEASGDLHGAALIRGLFAKDPECDVRCWGGDLMRAEGGKLVRHYRETAVMGFTEVFEKLGKIVGNLAFCKRDISKYRPDAVVLIDYPGFNLNIARFASRHGFKVFYYIPPKVWARGENRIRLLKKYVDRVFIIFPFEKKYFASRGIDVQYFGNPLLDNILTTNNKNIVRGKTISFFAGSRRAELGFLMPRLVELERLIRDDSRYDGFELVLSGAPSLTESDYVGFIPEGSSLKLQFTDSCKLLRRSLSAVVCSGTASLEAAYTKTPQVVCYGFSKITFVLARCLVKIKYISLANLILDKPIFRELIQDEVSAVKLKSELDRITFDREVISRMENDYDKVIELSGAPGASLRVAEAMKDALFSEN